MKKCPGDRDKERGRYMRMLSIYKAQFDQLMIKKPGIAKATIEKYLNLIIGFYERNRSLASVEILDILYRNREDPLLRERMVDVYQQYEHTNFLINELDQDDIILIKKRYIEEIVNLGRGYNCVIQA